MAGVSKLLAVWSVMFSEVGAIVTAALAVFPQMGSQCLSYPPRSVTPP